MFHLVAKGTLEELVYLRQMYKQSVQRTVEGNALEQMFEGIQGDPENYGELFGMENIMQYTEHSLIEEMQTRYAGKQKDSTSEHPSVADDADVDIARIAAKEKENTKKKREINIPVQRFSAENVLEGFNAIQKDTDGEEELFARVARLPPAPASEAAQPKDDNSKGRRSSSSSSSSSSNIIISSSSSASSRAAPLAHGSPPSSAVSSSPRRRLMPGNILSEAEAVLQRPVYKE